ncbi:MAG: ATP-binding protein, partial [Bacteroidales bacterium]|nr:ATP-binding protein [Bacteroidales bacterium]
MGNELDKQTEKKMDILFALDRIVCAAEGSKLSKKLYKQNDKYIKYVCSKLDITQVQCVLLAVFVEKSNDRHILLSELAEFLGCRTTQMLRISNEIDVLVDRDYIRRGRSSDMVSYSVPMGVLDAFKQDQALPSRNIDNLSLADFFNTVAEIFELVEDDSMDILSACKHIREILDRNKHLPFVEKVTGDYKLEEKDVILLLIFCNLFIENADDKIGFRDMKFMFHHVEMRIMQMEMVGGYSILQKAKLIEWSGEEGFADRETFRLTKQAKRELLDGLNLPSLAENNVCSGVVKTKEIIFRNMFYATDVTHRVNELGQLLEEDHYQDIKTRLKEKGFRCGFTCLFYGAPGTGKTETVLQLARRTGRDILQVDFSEIKSMWVGESEKNIQTVFDEYRHIVKSSAITPILLFNEADAIIGKRKEGAERAVDKMENAIQNIILQELETLEGIFVATTNLVQNMDKAFERRFLYKIRFDMPSVEVRTAIWQEMIPSLDLSEASKLAARYDLSGGQIENIARHFTIDAILHGINVPTAETLALHCDNESISNGMTKSVGFISYPLK